MIYYGQGESLQVIHLVFLQGDIGTFNFGSSVSLVMDGSDDWIIKAMSVNYSSVGFTSAFTNSLPRVLCRCWTNHGLGICLRICEYPSWMVIILSWLHCGGGKQLKINVFWTDFGWVDCKSCWHWLNFTVLVHLPTSFLYWSSRILKMVIMALEFISSVLALRYLMHSPQVRPLKTDQGWLEV